MKKISLSLMAIAFAINFSYAQNTFPTSGNVGIGTTSPGAALGFQNLDTDAGNSGITWYNPSPLNYGIYKTTGSWTAPNYQQLKLAWATGILLDPGNLYAKSYVEVAGGGLRVTSGNVGIGTTNPAYALDVNGSARFSVNSPDPYNTMQIPLILSNGAGNGGAGTQINFSIGSATSYINSIIDGPNSLTGSALSFGTPSTGSSGTERLRITSKGNVGIGTSTPSAKLQTNYVFTDPFGVSIQGGPSSGTALTIGGSAGDSGASVVSIAPGWNTNASPYALDISPTGVAFGTDTRLLNISFAGSNKMVVMKSGNVGVGTTNPDQKLTVKGTIHSQEVIVDMSVLPDYVFKPAYHLPTLTEVKTYIDKNHHLPEMPSAGQVEKEGLSLGDMNAKLLKKLEELTLYLIEKDKIITDQQKQLTNQKNTDKFQQQEIDELKKQISPKHHKQ